MMKEKEKKRKMMMIDQKRLGSVCINIEWKKN